MVNCSEKQARERPGLSPPPLDPKRKLKHREGNGEIHGRANDQIISAKALQRAWCSTET